MPVGFWSYKMEKLCRLLHLPDIRGLKSLRTVDHFKGYLLTFGESLETISLNGREVNKNVFTVLLFNKTKTLCIVKPFNCTLSHFSTPFLASGTSVPKFHGTLTS